MTTAVLPHNGSSLIVIAAIVCAFGCALLARVGTAASDGPASSATASIDPQTVLRRMEASYGNTLDYRAHLVISGFGGDPSFRTPHKVRYVFKKPNRIRIDFEHPHPGMTIVYPDALGRVVVRPIRGLSSLLFHFRADSAMVEISPGQQVHQTDLGLLIENIGRSVGSLMVGDLHVEENRDLLLIRVLSDNPFARGTPTRYTYTIDKRLWLQVAVEESTVAWVLKRKVVYEDLKINTGVKDGAFDLG